MASAAVGTCQYCKRTHAPLIDEHELREDFELLASTYHEDAGGHTLLHWLRADWAMFPEDQIGDETATTLLTAILGLPAPLTTLLKPSDRGRTDTLALWRKFREELMYVNRFFPQEGIDLGRLRNLLEQLLPTASEVPGCWYRARLHTGGDGFGPDQMGAPPKEKATHGRANPAGIPYLYLASSPDTAISEIRPHSGEMATVAEFAVGRGLKLVDLRHPRLTVSPFVLGDEIEVALLRGDIAFLEQLGDELTRPVVPQAAAINYTPSQYLCEFVKNCGYDGVLYRSSVSDGINLALFHAAQAVILGTTSYVVSKVSVAANPVNENPS